MREDFLLEGAHRLVTVNARVTPGEAILIVTDEPLQWLACLIAEEARKAGGDVVTCRMAVRPADGAEPPTMVAAAMREAKVVFSAVSKSITHSHAMRKALDQGARAVLMTGYTKDLLTSPALLKTDFAVQSSVCRRLGKIFDHGSQVRLTSPRGTDLTFSIKGRKANVLTNIPAPGELAPVPDIEVNVVPVTGSANGRLVADASVPYLGIGILKEQITCEIEAGSIVSLEGGEQARILSDDLSSHGNRNCYNVAELGIGLNPNARLTGTMLDDEGVLGTIHLGIGTSFTLGGEVRAPIHYDLLMWAPRIEVDGRLVQDDRQILV